MIKSFVVTVELLDGSDVAATAQDIFELLSEEYKVQQVNPWAVPDVQPIAPPDFMPPPIP